MKLKLCITIMTIHGKDTICESMWFKVQHFGEGYISDDLCSQTLFAAIIVPCFLLFRNDGVDQPMFVGYILYKFFDHSSIFVGYIFVGSLEHTDSTVPGSIVCSCVSPLRPEVFFWANSNIDLHPEVAKIFLSRFKYRSRSWREKSLLCFSSTPKLSEIIVDVTWHQGSLLGRAKPLPLRRSCRVQKRQKPSENVILSHP